MAGAAPRDLDLQTLVHAELEWTPDVHAAGIGVAVRNGAVTLSGEVASAAERRSAVRAARRVAGVRELADELTISSPRRWPIGEAEIARNVDRALRSTSTVPDTVKAEVDGHGVTLVGEVAWDYQRRAAERTVEDLRGVYTVKNMIGLRARPSAADAEQRIRAAIARDAQLDAQTVHAALVGNRAVLTGTVRSWAEYRQAGLVAWASPHVAEVDNRIVVDPLWRNASS